MAIPTVGAIADVVGNQDDALAEWANAVGASSVGRVVHRFASTAERDAAIPVPPRGAIAVTTDTDTMWQAAGAPSTWRRLPGAELWYVEITAPLSITAPAASGAQVVVNSGARDYDGSPVVLEFFSPAVVTPNVANGQTFLNLWRDGADQGFWGGVYSPTAQIELPVTLRRRITPTAGQHTFVTAAWVNGGSGTVNAGPTGVAQFQPAYMRAVQA